MFEKLRVLTLAFVWGLFDRIGVSEKILTVARGGTAWFKAYSPASGEIKFPVNLGMLGASHLAQPGANRAQVGFQTILAVTIVFVLAMVAVVVADSLDTSIGTPSSTALSEAQNDILTGFGDMASLIGVLFLVAIVVVIIFQLRRVQ